MLDACLIFISVSLSTALTADNVLKELKDVSWETLSRGKVLSDGEYQPPGVLGLPDSQRRKIEAEYTTEDQWRNAAVHFWLISHPYASWRRLITKMGWYEEYAVAKRIHCYAEKLTGMTSSHQIVALYNYAELSLAVHFIKSVTIYK